MTQINHLNPAMAQIGQEIIALALDSSTRIDPRELAKRVYRAMEKERIERAI